MKATILQHSYLEGPAICFEVKGEYCIVSRLAVDKFQIWWTGCDVTKPTDVNKFLDECAKGKHSTQGTAMAGSFADVLILLSKPTNKKQPFYFTFGQKYFDEVHPNYPLAHPDGWVTIMAVDRYTARMKSVEIFGKGPRGDVLFAFQYDDENFKREAFPRGEIERFEA